MKIKSYRFFLVPKIPFKVEWKLIDILIEFYYIFINSAINHLSKLCFLSNLIQFQKLKELGSYKILKSKAFLKITTFVVSIIKATLLQIKENFYRFDIRLTNLVKSLLSKPFSHFILQISTVGKSKILKTSFFMSKVFEDAPFSAMSKWNFYRKAAISSNSYNFLVRSVTWKPAVILWQ